MQTELDVIDALNALGYSGKCVQEEALAEGLKSGLNCDIFKDLVCWLAAELHVLRKTDEIVSTELQNQQDLAMELSAFLKELRCPYNKLVTGPLEVRFANKAQCLLLLDFLISELMVTKMHLYMRPQQQNLIIEKSTTNTALALEKLAHNLNIGQPPTNVTPKAYFDKLNYKLEEKIREVKPGVLSEPLLTKRLTDAQWQKLEGMCNDLEQEYNLRRQMLLTRLEVTVQSFNWSERLLNQQQQITERFEQQMQELQQLSRGDEETDMVALLAARKDLAIIEKTSSAYVRKNTACKIQKHVIGNVPDRGGRAYEHAPPPPEMPAWQQQRAGGGGGFGGRGGGRGGFGQRGGRGGGGQNQSQPQRPQYQQQQHYNQPQQQQSYDRRGNNTDFVSGSGRVQGSGWTQSGHQDRNEEYRRGGGRGGGYNRGQSNYNRGGRR